jgi:hypothetical protein
MVRAIDATSRHRQLKDILNRRKERAISAIDVSEVGDDAPDVSFARTTPLTIPLDNPYFRLASALNVINSRRGHSQFKGPVCAVSHAK